MSTEHSAVHHKLQAIHRELSDGFKSGVSKGLPERMALLEKLEALVIDHQDSFCKAIQADLGRPTEDSIIAELSVVVEEVQTARKNLKKWMTPQSQRLPLVLFPARGYIAPVPFGVTLIIGPWNYPVQLLLAPLVAALAAGNCAVLKPSELTPRCAELMAELIPKYFPSNVVQVVNGGIETSQSLLELKWDFLFFTGSTAVGKLIAQAAAKHLTPVVLELGGKSPCLVDKDANLDVAARRILWGKTLNAGQTCVAPDYILTPKENVNALINALEKGLKEFFPKGFVREKNFCGIVNQKHFERLSGLASNHTSALRLGGKCDPHSMLIEPSLYVFSTQEAKSAPIMQEEIFGPLLPIVAVESIGEATRFINENEHPLTLYVFSGNEDTIEMVERNTQSGSFVVNDTVIQLATSKLPFGGVGASGQGSYHGKAGFEAFSHKRSVLKRPFWLDVPVRYRPMAPWKIWILRKLLNFKKSARLPSPVP